MTEFRFPDFEPIVDEAGALYRQGRLPHAVLLTSDSGLGLESTAQIMASRLLCDVSVDGSCGRCNACQLLAAGTHGDYRWLTTLEGKASIGIDQIRGASDFITKTASYGSLKVLVVAEADRMTNGAANALLKTLEEPSGNSVIFMLARRPWLLPPTIRSRCQSWKMPRLSRLTCSRYLQEHGIAITSEVEENPRLLERTVVTHAGGKSDSVAELYGLVNAVLDGSMGSHDLALGLRKFELMEAVDATVTAIEDRLLSQDTGKASMMATLSVHRAVATILQRLRAGAVPAKETACYEIAALMENAGNNQVSELERGLRVLGS